MKLPLPGLIWPGRAFDRQIVRPNAPLCSGREKLEEATAAYSLSRLGDSSAEEIAVAWALGRIGTAGSVSPLVVMVSEPDHAVGYTAADALDRTARRLLQGESAGGA